MNKRVLIILLFCSAGGTLTVFLLSLLSQNIAAAKGSFLRAFRQHAINEHLELDLGINSYYVAGLTKATVFLGNHVNPLHALTINLSNGDSAHISLQVGNIYNEKFWSIQLLVDSPHFYLYDGTVPRIYKGETTTWRAERYPYDTEFFLDFEPIGPSSFAIKSLLGRSGIAALGKISPTTPHFTFMPEILKKQVDGFFCTDGHLHYDKQLNRLLYLYRYRNEYFVMDSSIHVISKSTTLDTNTVAKVDVVTIASSGTRVFQTPPQSINDKSALYGEYLFVNSMLLANNQSEHALEEASVIDVYHVTAQKYLFSFYLFDHHTGERMREFKVFDNRLIVLFRTQLQVFELDREYFPDL